MVLRQCPILWLLVACLWLCGGGKLAQAVDYAQSVKPLLKIKCVSCHGALKQEGNLRLDTGNLARTGGDSGAAVVPADVEGSLLWQRVTAEDQDERMPPEGEPLTADELKLIREWISSGAQSPADESPQTDPRDHWSFGPLEPVAVPARPGLQPIDAFIAEKLEAAGLSPAPPADARTLVRRLYMDVLGLPPAAENLESWIERIERDSGAVEQLVDQLLASPRHGEHAAQAWLDVVRYADTHGFEVNTPRPNAWPYRDYVIDALSSDKPYNQFMAEQVAGEQLGEDRATGFLVAAAVLLPGQIGQDDASKRLARQDALDEIIIGTSATFLGLTVGCARCHDHKFDPISQRDYYALQAFFAGVEYGDRAVKDEAFERRRREAAELGKSIAALSRELERYEPLAEPTRWLLIDDEDEDRVTHLFEKQGHGENPAGTKPGYRDDVGSATRSANLSDGRYTWWTNTPGKDTFTWNPAAAGRFRVWLSWGAHGSGVHTRDARYVLDQDGDLGTTDDQREIARADQYYRVGVTSGQTPQKPLWSGFFNAGVHEFGKASRLVLRGGDSGTGITADALLLQRVDETSARDDAEAIVPDLRAQVSPLRNLERFAPREAKFVRFTTLETVDNNKHEPCLDELEIYSGGSSTGNLARRPGVKASSSSNFSDVGKHRLSHINDGEYGNERSWISGERGGGWVQLELTEPAAIDTIVWGRDRNGKLDDRLPVRYEISVSIDGRDWSVVADHTDRNPIGTPQDESQSLQRRARALALASKNGQSATAAELTGKLHELAQLRTQKAELEKPREIFAGVFRQCDTTYVLNRGDPEQRMEEIGPHLPEIVGGLSASPELDDAQRRRVLAKWLESPTSGLVARVIVNRVWQNHFGSGLVETPSDFGLSGAPPSHPELLDWLAGELVAHQWSLKWLERTILCSRTYQQSSRLEPAASERDADNRLLWHYPARRLSAEAIRDSVLQTSGSLNLAMGGPGFDFFKVRGGLTGFPPIEKFTAAGLRRMIYAHKIRMERVPVFGVFDCPDAGQPSPKRSQSTTPIQALNLFNSSFIAEQAEAFAQRLVHRQVAAGKLGADEQVDAAFMAALGRLPQSDERQSAAAVVREHGLAVLCRVLLNSNEFLYLP
ncbi:MAG: DUF1553 domain-containing protein [Aureliella sp.]